MFTVWQGDQGDSRYAGGRALGMSSWRWQEPVMGGLRDSSEGFGSFSVWDGKSPESEQRPT